jgi:hypothetical protein
MNKWMVEWMNGYQIVNKAFSDPNIHTLYDLFPLNMGRTCNLFLTNKAWQVRWNVTPVITLYIYVSLLLHTLERLSC